MVAASATGSVYRGMMINLVANCAALVMGVALQLPGVPLAALALTLATVAEYAYLQRKTDDRRPVTLAGAGWSRMLQRRSRVAISDE